MDRIELLLRLTLGAYGLSVLFYLVSFALESRVLDRAGIWAARLAFLLHAVLIGLRWNASGLGHPPWISPFESLIFFSFMAVGAHFFALAREGVPDARSASAFGPTVLAGGFLLLALVSSGHGVEPLEPVLRSPWLWVHGLAGALAFGWLSSGAASALFRWVLSPVSVDAVHSVFSILAALLIGAVEKPRLLAGDPIAIAAVALFLGHFVLASGWILLHEPKPQSARAKGEADGVLLQAIFFIGFVALLALCGQAWLARHAGAHRRALLALFVISGFFAVMLSRFRPGIALRLAEERSLDRMAYRAILQGLPLQLLTLVTGGIWAFFAWGSYWSWDPKQVWALVTTLFYAAFLHQKSQARAGVSELVAWAILGFLSALFTYQWVPFVLPTSHAFSGGG